jgi:hypothetical protein
LEEGNKDEVKRRCRIKLLPASELPLWEHTAPDLLSTLSVAKAHGGTVFKVTSEQWKAVYNLATGPKSAELPVKSFGQGPIVESQKRKSIELYAQRLAEDYFRELSYDVTDVSPFESFDLRCITNDEELHVEVKGTSGSGDTIILTRNEVVHARSSECETVLFIVKNIEYRPHNGVLQASGGEQLIYRNWIPMDELLRPLQYQYLLPED